MVMRWLQASLFALLLFGTGATTTAQSVGELAAFAYEQGNYPDAIVLYESLIDEGDVSGELFFNLANAYFEDEQFGLALLNYRRAMFYFPRDNEINLSMAQIRGRRVNLIEDETDWINQIGELTDELMTLRELSYVTFALWNILFVFVAIGAFQRRWGTNLRLLVGVCLTVTSIAGGLLFTRMYMYYERPAAIIIGESVAARTGPDDTYQRLFTLFDAAEIRVLEKRDGWVRFALPGGRQGWLPESSLAYPNEPLQ